METGHTRSSTSMRPWKNWLLLIDINMFWYEIFNVKITLVESLLKSWKMIHPQSYQYFAKLTILPVIFAWAITIVACIVVGEPWFLAVCFAPYPAPHPSLLHFSVQEKNKKSSELFHNYSPAKFLDLGWVLQSKVKEILDTLTFFFIFLLVDNTFWHPKCFGLNWNFGEARQEKNRHVYLFH